MSFLLRAAAPLLFVSIVACASKSSDPPTAVSPLSKCVQNQTLVCLCGLDEGTQTCTEDGALTPCACPNAPTTPADTVPPPPPPPPDAGPPPGVRCGNGVLEPGEACDDGNSVDGDGCSTSCAPDGAPSSGQTCPGQPVAIWKGTPVALAGSTASYSDVHSAGCYGAYGPDRVFALTPEADGVLTVDASFDQGFDAIVSVRATCNVIASETLCEDTLGSAFKHVVSVTKGKTIYLLVDGDAPSASGAFAVRLELL